MKEKRSVWKSMAKGTIITGMAMLLGACGGRAAQVGIPDGGKGAIECGGVQDSSNPDAPKVIESDELVSFQVTFDREGYVPFPDETAGDSGYPAGRYRFEMKKEGEAVLVSADFADDDYSFTAGPDALSRLDTLLKDNDVPSMNGHSKWNSALGTYIRLSASYADGETISINAEGGVSTIPAGWNPSIYICFFDELLEECTGQCVWKTYITDDSDPDAPKEFSSQELRYIYARFCYRYGHMAQEGQKRPGQYLLHLDFDHLRYADIDDNCTIWRDSSLLGSFNADEEDAALLQEWIKSHDLITQNGAEKTSKIDSYESLELTVCYADESELSVHVYGRSVIPKQWDSESFLELIGQIAEKHGLDAMEWHSSKSGQR